MKPEIIKRDSFKVIGIKCRTTRKDNLENHTIPNLWGEFLQKASEIKNRVGKEMYGVCGNADSEEIIEEGDEVEFDYLACVEVNSFNDIPDGMVKVEVPANRYAKFTHKGDLSGLKDSYSYIYGKWILDSGHEICGYYDVELYGEKFKGPENSESEMDILIPIK